MADTKIFIMDSRRSCESLPEVIQRVVNKKNEYGKLEIRLKQQKLTSIPRDYDLYILHISDVNEGDLKQL